MILGGNEVKKLVFQMKADTFDGFETKSKAYTGVSHDFVRLQRTKPPFRSHFPGKMDRNWKISMGKVTSGLTISPKTSIVRVQTGRTLFSGWRLQRKLEIARNVIVNDFPRAEKWP